MACPAECIPQALRDRLEAVGSIPLGPFFRARAAPAARVLFLDPLPRKSHGVIPRPAAVVGHDVRTAQSTSREDSRNRTITGSRAGEVRRGSADQGAAQGRGAASAARPSVPQGRGCVGPCIPSGGAGRLRAEPARRGCVAHAPRRAAAGRPASGADGQARTAATRGVALHGLAHAPASAAGRAMSGGVIVCCALRTERSGHGVDGPGTPPGVRAIVDRGGRESAELNESVEDETCIYGVGGDQRIRAKPHE